LREIGEGAFLGCELTSISIPSDARFGEYCFDSKCSVKRFAVVKTLPADSPSIPKEVRASEVIVDFSSFRKVGDIDRGSSGVVELWEDEKKKQVAMKIFYLGKDFDNDHFLREVELLANTKGHPCIVVFVGCSLPCDGFGGRIATEYLKNGTLFEVLEAVKSGHPPTFWTPTQKAKMIMGIVVGMKYLHSQL
jgi:serine/threonine protein kinase